MTLKKRIAWLAGTPLALLVITIGAGIIALRSDWFLDLVRHRIVSTVEDATGGRVEIKSVHFDWRTLRAEVRGFVLHGTEAKDKPPLFAADAVTAGLKIISLLRRDVHIESLAVVRPRVYLIFRKDGSNNVPEPKVKKPTSTGDPVVKLLDLAIGTFQLRDGSVDIEDLVSVPFSLNGKNLNARLSFDPKGPRYKIAFSAEPVAFAYPGIETLPVNIQIDASLEKGRIVFAPSTLRVFHTEIKLTGVLDNLAGLGGAFDYEVRATLGDLQRTLELSTHLGGPVLALGHATCSITGGIDIDGHLHGKGLDYRDPDVNIHGVDLDATVAANLSKLTLLNVRATGFYTDSDMTVPASAHIAAISLHKTDVTAPAIDLAMMGGSFHGGLSIDDFDRFRAQGSLAGFEVRHVAAFYSKQTLPWDARLSGEMKFQSNLRGESRMMVDAALSVDPAVTGAPVHGALNVHYDRTANLLDLDRSWLALPNTNLTLAGGVGRKLIVRVRTTDLNELLPAFNVPAQPVTLPGTGLTFQGEVTGPLDEPRMAGHLATGRFTWQGQAYDSLAFDATAAADGVAARNVHLARGPMRVDGSGSISLMDWAAADASTVAAELSLRNAPLADLALLAGAKAFDGSGTITANAHLTGTMARPILSGDVAAVRGAISGEPFDAFTAQLAYRDRTVNVTAARVTAGPRQVDFTLGYQHAEKSMEQGRLRFDVKSNTMPLDQFRSLDRVRPGIHGTVTMSAQGTVDVLAPTAPGDRVRLLDLHADVRGRDLQVTGQPLGDARLTAESKNGQLTASVASDFANSRIRGEGQWQLRGDYPGAATITFTRFNFANLQAWLAPAGSHPANTITGTAEGELKFAGPVRTPNRITAQLSILKIEAASTSQPSLSIHNQGPIVARLANQVVTVESAHMAGRSTDFTVAGKASLDERNPLDVRVNGRVDLALIQTLDRDVLSAGTVEADATIRGTFAAPQVGGRMVVKDASLNLADIPNGISRANGTLIFTGDRATIQSLTGETGGGRVRITGFIGYGGGDPIFRLQARAEQVRVRYPEGVSTMANANLTLTGTVARSLLAGTITVLRTGFNPQSDLSSLLARSAEPVRTPAARAGFMGGLNFDVQIATSPDITFQSPLAQGLQVEANLRLRGNASNPGLQGRVNVTQGSIVFFGTRYNINQGSVSFYNQVKIEPVLNVDLQTKARGVDVTLTVSGPLNKLTLTPRSDPPLQFSEIVALLATGRTPTSDPSLLAQQSDSPQNWQQMGASALLGQAIANPVAGRLQRFFGVSKLKIDPSLTGVTNNPQARLTIEQQVSQNITFTYITNVTSSNPQVVRIEWALNRNWSAVAVREENGLFGLDFFFKKRFK